MKLISMTDFILEQEAKLEKSYKVAEKAIESIFRYANFLKQPLTLGMFVPCDKNGNVLNEKICDYNKYHQAKECVLFEGFYVHCNAIIGPDGNYLNTEKLKRMTIESIMRSGLLLTESAKRQIIEENSK